MKPSLSSIVGAIISGVLYFVGFCGFDQWYLAWICLVPLLLAIEDRTPRAAFLLGWIMGVVQHAGGFYWLVHTISVFGKFPIPLAVAFSAALWIFQGLSMGIFAWLAVQLPRDRTGLLITFSYLTVEFLFPFLFPNYIGNSQYKVPLLIQTAELGGPLLVSFLVVYVNVALFGLFSHGMGVNLYAPYRRLAAAIVLVVAAALFGRMRMESIEKIQRDAPKVRVGVVQPNMGIYAKREQPGEGLRRHIAASRRLQDQGVDLVIWSEAGYMHYIGADETEAPFMARYGLKVPILFGTLRNDGEERFNSAMITDAQGRLTGHYDKVYLLAFGEYIPFGDRYPKLYDLTPNTGHFTKGTTFKPLPHNGFRLSALICYEDILAGFVRKVVREARPNLLVNLTNDAWFGDSNEPEIHLALATFRSVEHRRWMIRATNSGVSAFIDATGRIVSRTQVFEEAALVDKAAMLDLPPTLYALIGDALGWLAILVTFSGLLWTWTLRFRTKGRTG